MNDIMAFLRIITAILLLDTAIHIIAWVRREHMFKAWEEDKDDGR